MQCASLPVLPALYLACFENQSRSTEERWGNGCHVAIICWKKCPFSLLTVSWEPRPLGLLAPWDGRISKIHSSLQSPGLKSSLKCESCTWAPRKTTWGQSFAKQEWNCGHDLKFWWKKDFRCLLKSGRKRKKILYLKPICTKLKEKNCGFSLSPLSPPPTFSFHFQTLAYMVGFHLKKGIIPGDCRLEDKPLISITNTTNKYVLCCCQTAREE